jgi:hypothetical protein
VKIKKRKLKEVNHRYFVPEDFRRSSKWWNIEVDGLSSSAISTFLNDREQFRLAFVEGWRSIRAYSFHKEWGSLFHYVHKKWVCGEYDDLKTHIAEFHERFLDRYDNLLKPQIREQQEIGYALMRATWPHYAKFRKDDLKRDWFLYENVLKVEYEGIPLVAQLDGGWREKQGPCLHEMKTHAQINPRHFMNSLHLDLQMMLYLYVMKRTEGKVYMGQRDIIRRSSASPYARTGETLKQFRDRIANDIKKRPNYYFMRFPLEEINDSIDDWERLVLRPIVHEIKDWAAGKARHFPTGIHAHVPRPWGSDYFDPIIEQDFSEMSREKAYAYHEKE